MSDPRVTHALAAVIGTRVDSVEPLPGGDVNRAMRVILTDGRTVFVKHRADAPPGMYRTEADGLEWLADAGALRVPEVVAVDHRLLSLEWIEPGSPGPAFAEELGRGLAALHRAGAPSFGLHEDNFIGPIPQSNDPCESWPDFYAGRRIAPLARRARDEGRLTEAVAAGLERVCARMAELCGPPEPPARLHGDLWSGNLMTDSGGRPVLIDPSVHGGHREVDLAMMRLFGGFPERVFAAYDEAHPLAPGSEARVALFQLYPLLVHVLLFGGAYGGRLEAALRRIESHTRRSDPG